MCIFQIDGTIGATVNSTNRIIYIVADGEDCTSVTASPPAWYEFTGWTGDYNGSQNPLTLTNITSGKSVVANFRPQYAAGGTPYWWLNRYNLTNGGWTFDQAETNNPDHDPFSNADEYLCDTDPTNAQSYFHITGLTVTPPQTIYFESSSNRYYSLRACYDLIADSWTNISNKSQGSGGPDTLQDTNSIQGAVFYKINISRF